MEQYSSTLVSIVTPAFRAARFVKDAIEGVQNQTYKDWELLVVDDASPDDTAAVVEAYAARDPRVRLLRQERNGGPALARNRALEEAKGRYIAFCDSDDIWPPEKLQVQIDFMRSKPSAFSFTAYRRIDERNTAIGHVISVPKSIDYSGLLRNTAIATSTVILDRQQVGDVRMTKTFYDDLVLWLSILKKGGVAHGLNQDLMRYRVVGGSWSRSKTKSARMVWRTYRDIEGLSAPVAAWCLLNYGVRGLIKYSRF